ncbi:MAG TPA: hypothetical protein VLJ83_02430, partial [Gemmatimonadaceae bacterium]|nr:hypothetical protein [Gemmatimonadaceae bacterium]
ANLTGPFATYLQIMLASAESRWASADSTAVAALAAPETQGIFRINAMTSHASALAARGSVRAADSVLRAAALSSKGSTARWYERARLTLAIATTRGAPQRVDVAAGDTSAAADMLRGLWASAAGDTARARSVLVARRNISPQDRALVGSAPSLIEAGILARAGRWRDVVNLVGPIAQKGEQDPTILDRPDSYLQRWIVANAYQALGMRDSADAYLTLIRRPTDLPPGHFSLRGLSYAFATERLSNNQTARGDSPSRALPSPR